MTKKSTKKALLMSALSLLLCCAMLVGSTFAWFSDTAKTGKNTITAGNLDIELEYLKEKLSSGTELEKASWEPADKATDLFALEDDEEFKWEPGAMLISKPFRLRNAGDLALQYSLTAKVNEETKTKDGKSLTDVIKMKIVNASVVKEKLNDVTTGKQARKDFWENLKNSDDAGNVPEMKIGGAGTNGILLKKGDYAGLEKFAHEPLPEGLSEAAAGETLAKVVVLYWAPQSDDVDNLYNLNNGKKAESEGAGPLTIEFGLNVYATQFNYESDSFGPNYDGDIHLSVPELNEDNVIVFEQGTTTLTNDILLTDEYQSVFVHGGVEYTVDLNGNTVSSAKDAAFYFTSGASVTIEGPGTVSGNYSGYSTVIMAGANAVINGGTFEKGIYVYEKGIEKLEDGKLDWGRALTINDGTFYGLININNDNCKDCERSIICVNGGDFENAQFQKADKGMITLGNGLKWVDCEDGTEYCKIVKSES